MIAEITLFSNVFIVLSAFLYFQSYIPHFSYQIAFKFKLTLSKMLLFQSSEHTSNFLHATFSLMF